MNQFLVILFLTTSPIILSLFLRKKKRSKYELAAEKLGFNGCTYGNIKIDAETQQEALLKQFQIAGYFQANKIWQDLNCIGGLINIESVFKEVYKVIKASNADQNEPYKFDASYMRKNLFNLTCMDLQDCMDLILYIGQHGFNRKQGQERNELSTHDWIHKHRQYYIEQAKQLGLIERHCPKLKKYDFAWIAGASRVGCLARIIDYDHILRSNRIYISGKEYILAGNRELWASFDGIDNNLHRNLLFAFHNDVKLDDLIEKEGDHDQIDSINEAKEYMLALAERYNIKLNTNEPLIEYKTKDECPKGRFPYRVYPNYDQNESLKLTETLMCDDLLKIDLKGKLNNRFEIIDTQTIDCRPTTATTVIDATKSCIDFIKLHQDKYKNQKVFNILFQSNNPYIERQALTAQLEAIKVLKSYGLDYKFIIEGIGFAGDYEDVQAIHSEFGALITEKWKLATHKESTILKRDLKDLLFQTRNNNNTLSIPPMPKFTI